MTLVIHRVTLSHPVNASYPDDFNHYKDLLQLHMNWHQSGKNILQLDSTDIVTLEQYASGNSRSARGMARSILSYGYNYQFCNCLQSGDSSYYKANNSLSKSLREAFGPDITAIPNPADAWVAFNYQLKTKDSFGYISISDASGKMIRQFRITGKQGQIVWDTRMIDSGVYFYTFESKGGTKTGKIVISK
ncbi:MAG: T9SS type A sorting domain-containing protein [Bacteroidales bacterium]|nr:T9SS type A sorting domain-containing protein [Bacteroidales bacterium]MCF8399115.1 T9SS type A sorting domain-containing protein [Bacteroidales bacterium]